MVSISGFVVLIQQTRKAAHRSISKPLNTYFRQAQSRSIPASQIIHNPQILPSLSPTLHIPQSLSAFNRHHALMCRPLSAEFFFHPPIPISCNRRLLHVPVIPSIKFLNRDSATLAFESSGKSPICCYANNGTNPSQNAVQKRLGVDSPRHRILVALALIRLTI